MCLFFHKKMIIEEYYKIKYKNITKQKLTLKKYPLPIGFEEEGIAQTPDGRTTCLKCLRTFSTAHNAERHYRNQHMTTEKAPCKFCQRSFKNKSSLDEHLRSHHGITQSMLKCRIVPKPGPELQPRF